jgi:hypothetical protein
MDMDLQAMRVAVREIAKGDEPSKRTRRLSKAQRSAIAALQSRTAKSGKLDASGLPATSMVWA